MQLAFGAVYAWSVFRIPLSQAHGWTIAEVTAAFEVAIYVLSATAFAGGLLMKRSGPRAMRLRDTAPPGERSGPPALAPAAGATFA